MSSDLPSIIVEYGRAMEAGDSDDAVACFTRDAEVIDEGRTWRGIDQNRAWRDGPASAFEYTRTVVSGRAVDDHRYVLRTRLEGNFPGGVVDLAERFLLRDGLISRLEIVPRDDDEPTAGEHRR